MIEATGAAQFAVSANGGALVYLEGATVRAERDLVWVDRQGRSQPLLKDRTFSGPRLAPDGTRLAYATTEGLNSDIQIVDLGRSTTMQLTTHRGEDFGPTWSPDGARVAFASEIGEEDGEVGPGLAWSAGGGAVPERLLKTPGMGEWDLPTSFTLDRPGLVFSGRRVGTRWDVFFLPLAGDRRPQALVQSPFDDYDAAVSPDGRWVAYVTDETGQDEVCIRPIWRADAERYTVSSNGGTEPCWSPKGHELFYRDGDRMMVADIDQRTGLPVGAARLLFTGRFLHRDFPGGPRNYDVDKQGRFVIVARKSDSRPRVIHVLLGWAGLIGQK